ncbi:c-type cytochrome [Hymenobacter latericus]|uniref:c-type cytochrome n=1 Tax=Hymenobacter sp. YIM 151858-1 TaxID=2987688 RepID=UPI002225D5DC|nr:cytochrome c [Hymenobacter sp. YIM 151858-1]UYZ59277.1 cytochrome c [Hymenobacter sp. YIM 151858-1]
MTHFVKYGVQASAIVFASVLVTACNDANDPGLEYAPQMYESIPYEPLKQYDANTVNPMGINMRNPAIATVPRGKLDYFNHIGKDSVGIASRTLRNPLAYSRQNLEEGKVLYTRVCQHCHGEQGDGNGPVGAKFKGVPNYSAGAYANMNDAHIYHVIQWGKGRMMPHGSIVNPEERWKIAMYVRVLQKGKGPEGMSELVQDELTPTQKTNPENQEPYGQAQADKASETPGQGGTEARNGTAE